MLLDLYLGDSRFEYRSYYWISLSVFCTFPQPLLRNADTLHCNEPLPLLSIPYPVIHHSWSSPHLIQCLPACLPAKLLLAIASTVILGSESHRTLWDPSEYYETPFNATHPPQFKWRRYTTSESINTQGLYLECTTFESRPDYRLSWQFCVSLVSQVDGGTVPWNRPRPNTYLLTIHVHLTISLDITYNICSWHVLKQPRN
jgi:hypothetical protein